MRRTFSAAWPATAAAWGRFQLRTTPPCWWSPQGRRPTGTDGPSAAAWPCCRGTPPSRGDLQAASAVSYGSGPKNTLTLSSREGRKLWLALQRELVTIQGQVVDRQEFPWMLDHGASPQSALAVAGALLLLGVPPEQLSAPHFPA